MSCRCERHSWWMTRPRRPNEWIEAHGNFKSDIAALVPVPGSVALQAAYLVPQRVIQCGWPVALIPPKDEGPAAVQDRGAAVLDTVVVPAHKGRLPGSTAHLLSVSYNITYKV